jgi:hypothetical protein
MSWYGQGALHTSCPGPTRQAKLTRRYNEAVKASLTTRKAEVAELYQPMTEAMRQCQDAVTGCMEAMLVELKRDHSLVRPLLLPHEPH